MESETPMESLKAELDVYQRPVTDINLSENERAFEVLKGNTFGILDSDGTLEEKMIRLVNLLPMAFHVMDEARSTIARLRDELDDAREI
jgi:hypothetical protein